MYVISRLSKDRAKSLKENNGNEELISVMQQIGEVSERISEKAELLQLLLTLKMKINSIAFYMLKIYYYSIKY